MTKWPWDHVYILNLEYMKEKYDKLIYKLNKVGINKNIERFIAVHGLKELPYGKEMMNTDNKNKKWLLMDKMIDKLKKTKVINNYNYSKNIINKNMGNGSQYIFPNLRPGEIGHLLSFIKICKDAKQKKYKNILILEDDATFDTKTFKKNFFNAYNNLPSKCDILFLGVNDLHIWKMGEPIQINKYICKLRGIISPKHPHKNGGIYGTHAIILNQKAINTFLQKAIPITLPSDVLIGKLINNYKLLKSYYICGQLITASSDISKSTTRKI